MDKSRNRITRAIYVPLSLILPLITLVLALYLLSGAAEAKSDMPTQQSIANDQASSNQPVNLPFAPNRLIIKLRSEALLNFRSGRAPSIDRLMNENRCLYIRPLFPSQSSLKKLNAPDLSSIQLIELETGGDVLAAVKAFSEDPNVEWAEPDYLAHAAAIPNDPLYPGQWALSHIHAPEAWDIVTGTPSVVIAVLDTGIDVDHPDLINRLWINPGETPGNDIDDDNNGYIDDVHGWNFIARNNEVDDDDGHGTKVAGVAAAEGNNAIGFSGICWNCRIMPVKVMQAGGVANYSDVALGVYYAAAKGAEVINLSLGGYANSKSLQSAIEAASQTSLIVAAAGDGNTNTPFYPAAYPQVLAVGGTTESDDRESSSNYGDWVDVAAPAVNITTTQNGGSYVSASGTSFAAPIVSGLAGLVRSQHPDWTSSMVQAQIIHTTDSIPASDLGSGRINALNAVTTSPHPMFEIDTTTINKDPLGRPEPGQDATLSVGLHNDWLDASSVTGTLTTSDSYVTIITGTASYGNIASGYSTSGSPMFVFNIASGAGYNHPIPFTLGLTSDGGIYTTTLPLTITTRSSDQNVSGTIMTNTTWTNDNTYIVVNNVGVAPGVTLTIKAGTMVKFNGNYNLNVGGTLVADGTETQPIRFMSNISSTWGKIYFDNPSTDAIADASGNYLGGNILHWVQVDDASEGIACNSATPYISHMTLTNGSVNCTRGDTIVWIQDSIIIGPGTDSTNNRGIVIGGTGYLIRNQVGGDGHRTWIKVGTASWLKENKVINGYVEAGTSSTIISNTVTNGIRFGGLIQGNIIGSGSCTSGIFGSNNTIIKKNIINKCNTGIRMEGEGVIENNIIANSKNEGLIIASGYGGGGGQVFSNTFIGIHGNTIVIDQPSPIIQSNNLVMNYGVYDIVNNTSDAIDASSNWWGTTEINQINQRIYDYWDEFSKGQVAYSPILTAPSTVAPAYLHQVTTIPDSPVGLETVSFDALFSKPMENGNLPKISFHDARKGTWELYTPANSGLVDINVRDIVIDDAGNTWFVYGDAIGTSVFRKNREWEHFTIQNSGLVDNRVRTIFVDRSLNVWFGTQAGLSVLHQNGTWQSYTTSNSGLSSNNIYSISQNSSEDLFIGTDNGLSVLDKNDQWMVLSTSNSGLLANNIRGVLVDHMDQVWVFYYDYLELGLSVRKIDNNWVNYNTSNSSLYSNEISKIDVDSKNNIWLVYGVWMTRFSRILANGKVDTFNNNNGWIGYIPLTVKVDKFDNVYFGDTMEKVSILHADGTWEAIQLHSYADIYAIGIDSIGNLWYNHQDGVQWRLGGQEYQVNQNARWVSDNSFIASYDVNVQIPRGVYSIDVHEAIGTDGMEIAPSSNFTFTVDYIGEPEHGTPPPPVVHTCASDSVSTLSASWSVPTTQTIGLYRYAIGTAPGLNDVSNWFTTTLKTVTRSNLNLLAGETYYFSVKARNTGGIWSEAGNSNGVVAGTGGCPRVDFSASPTSGDSPLAVTFATQVTDTVDSYLWSFGDGLTSTLTNPVHTYWPPNIYTTTLEAIAPGGWTTVRKSNYITITPDVTPPDGSLSINAGAEYVTTTIVSLSLTANDPSGVDVMRFSNDGSNYSSWETFATIKNWTLPSGDGQKTVYFQVRDAPGNIATFSASITLDSNPPAASVVSLPPFIGTSSFPVAWSGSDALSGLSSYDIQYRVGESGTWTDWITNTTQTTSTFSGSHGETCYFRARARDNLGNLGSYAPGDGDAHTTLDLQPPVGSVWLEGDVEYTNHTEVTLTLSASDLSGVEAFQGSNDGITYGEWISYTASSPWTLASGDGLKTVYVRLRDNVGHISDPISDTITLDTLAPDGSISINAGSIFTSNSVVTLTLSASDMNSGIYQMQFGNNGSTWSAWQDYGLSETWTLSAGDGTKTVFVHFEDMAGNISTYNDTIILDTTPPSVAVHPLTPYQTTADFSVSWSGIDALSGLANYDVQVKDGSSEWTDWVSASADTSVIFTGLDGHTYYFRARARDNLGNLSSYAPGDGDTSTTVDTTRPEGSILINGAAIETTSQDVILRLSANGAIQMAFSEDGINFGAWEPFTVSHSYRLSSGDGLKTVYVRYRDPADNITDASDMITLNSSLPGEEGLTINDDAPLTEEITVTLTLKAPTGTSQMMISNSSRFVTAEWEPYTTTHQWVLAYHPGVDVYQVYARFLSMDGIVSPRYDDLITLHLPTLPPPVDSTPPSGSMVINAGADSTSSQMVSLDVLAADNPGGVGVRWMYFREWKYDTLMVQWIIVKSSGWMPYAEQTNWQLSEGTGAKFVGAWFADAANNVSTPVVVDSINLILPGEVLGEHQVTQYRQTFEPGQPVTVTLTVDSGDADLYIWRPGSTGTPDLWSNLPGTAMERLVFTAVEGEYLIEVHGYTSSVYSLDIATSSGGASAPQLTKLSTAGNHPVQSNSPLPTIPAGKPLPTKPLVTTSPGEALPEEPLQIYIYLPIVKKSN